MSNIFNVSWKDVMGACFSTVIVAVFSYIVSIADVWAISFHTIVNIAVIAGIGSLLKSFLTTSEGKIAGVQVK